MNISVILVMVMSIDGKTTRWGNPKLHGWTSKEDQSHFAALIETHDVILMGRKTFDAARSMIKFPNPKLRIVLTRTPETFHDLARPGMLEFTKDPPRSIMADLGQRGHSSVLLAGGSEVNAAFLAAGCVTELWLSIEPRIFGNGHPLVASEDIDLQLDLKSVEHLNPRGTLLLKYAVESPAQLT